MDSISKILYLLFTLLFLAHPPQPYTFAKGDTKLMKKICKKTKYYDLCLSSLKSDPNSTMADTKGLALIMVGIGMANATSTSSYLSSLLLGSSRNDTTLKRVIKDCAEKYSYAAEALQDSAQDLSDEAYDYANVHVTAASDYPNVCHNLFRGNPDLVYPSELRRREVGLKRLCDVALGIIDNLNWY